MVWWNPKSTITSFPVFAGYSWKDLSAKPPRIVDLFDIKQGVDEPLREYLNRFCFILVDAFLKRLRANSFSDSLVRNSTISMAEVRARASIHIETMAL